MAFEDATNSTAQRVMDQASGAAEAARQTLRDGYESVRQLAEEKGLNFDVRDFVRREPWIAMASAFAIGYVAAQIVRRIS
jgi:hypothetical protein